jgi:MFS family permease
MEYGMNSLKKISMYFSRNVIILLILRAVRWFLVVMPVVTIFYREHGLSNQDIFILQAFYAIVVVLSEIPTGYFSDVLGRKKSLILGMIFGVIGLGTYAMTRDFW